MTEHRARAVSDCHFTSTDRLFLDANVWMYVNGPQSLSRKRPEVDVYSSMLGRIMVAGSRIYIDVLVVSELVNSWARMNWRLNGKNQTGSFKDYRNSDDFPPVAKRIAGDINHILQRCSPIEHHFEALNIDALMDEYAEGCSDFNDQVIAELCKREELTLITHDSDFKMKRQEISILTANPALLSQD